MPSIKECCEALADVVAAGGRPALAQQLRDHPAEIGEAEFAALAHELGTLPSQLFQSYLFRLAQVTGWRHRGLDRVRFLEATMQ